MNFKKNVPLFLKISLLLCLSYFNYNLLKTIKDVAIALTLGGAYLSQLKTNTIVVSIFAGFFAIALSWGGNTKRIFNIFFPLNSLLLAVFAYLFYVNHSILSNFSVISLFYKWASISGILSLSLAWGFSNQRYTLKLAAIHYPIMGLILNLPNMASNYFISWASSFSLSLSFCTILAVIAGVSLLIWLLHLNIIRYPSNSHDDIISFEWRYWIALAFIFFSITLAKGLPKNILQPQLKTILQDVTSYNSFLGNYSFTMGITGLVSILMSIALGLFISYRSTKILPKISAYVSLGIFIVSGFNFYYLQSPYFSSENLNIINIGHALSAFLVGIIVFLKELMFFGLNQKNRIPAKIAMDLFVVFFTSIFAKKIGSFCLLNFTVSSQTILFILVFFGILAAFCLSSLCYIHKSSNKKF